MVYRPKGTTTKYTLEVSRFKGVDLAGNPTSKSQARADFALNMITDGNGYPETRHGYEKVLTADGRINGVYSLQTVAGDKILVHHGTKLSEWANGTLTELYAAMADEKSTATQMENKLIILDGKAALIYANWGDEVEDDWALKLMSEVGYVPTTVISALPGATPGGTAYENVNLISDYQYNSFLVAERVLPWEDGNAEASAAKANPNCCLQLSDAPVSDVSVERLNASGTWDVVDPDVGRFTVDETTGTVDFTKYNDALVGVEYGLFETPVVGRDNYRVKFASRHTYTEQVSQRFDDPEVGSVYLCWPKDNPGDDTFFIASESEKNLLEGEYDSITIPCYRFRFRYPSVNLDDPVYLNIRNCSGTKEHRAAVMRSWLLGILSESKPAFVDGIVVYEKADFKTRMFPWLEKSGTDYFLNVAFEGSEKTYRNDTVIFSTGYEPVIYSCGIDYQKVTSIYPDRVNLCTIIQKYGYGGNADRIFVSGNPSMPNYDFWSSVSDPTYFPDLNYAQVGDESTAIMGYSWLSDGSLSIHKEWDGEDSTIYIRKAETLDSQVVFTLSQGAVGLGVVSSRCGGYLNGDPVQLSSEGVFATVPVYNTAINERYAQNRSYFVNPLLKKQKLAEAEAIVHKGKYYLSAGEYVFVADGDQKNYSTKGDQVSYEWYLWDNVPARIWWSDGKSLYFGDSGGNLFMFNDGHEDDGEPVKWEWLTPWLDFGRQTYYKKVKNVTVISAPNLGQSPVVEYRMPQKDSKRNLLPQVTRQSAPFLKGTNYKAKKISLLQLRISGEEAFGLSALSILYTVSGKFKE